MPPPEGGSGNASKFHENAAKSCFFGFLQSFRESSDLRFTKNLMELE